MAEAHGPNPVKVTQHRATEIWLIGRQTCEIAILECLLLQKLLCSNTSVITGHELIKKTVKIWMFKQKFKLTAL